MKRGLQIDGVTLVKRLDHRDYGTDRWEVRCGCGKVFTRSTSTIKMGGKAIGRESDFLGCLRCYMRAYDATWRLVYGVEPPRGGGAA